MKRKKVTLAEKKRLAADHATANRTRSDVEIAVAEPTKVGDTTVSADVPETQEPVVAAVRNGIEEQKKGAVELELQPESLTPEAKAWVNNPKSIPGCVYLSLESNGSQVEKPFPPCRANGWATLDEISVAIGRQITLEEIMFIIQPDGDSTRCLGTGILFQPLRWWKHCPRNLKEQIAAGKRLQDIEVDWAGAFFWMDMLKEPRAFSGSQFKSNGQLSNGSPLIMAARAKAKAMKSTNRHVWGRSRGEIASWLQRRKDNKRASQDANDEVKDRIDTAFGVGKTKNLKNAPDLADWTPSSDKSNGDGDKK